MTTFITLTCIALVVLIIVYYHNRVKYLLEDIDRLERENDIQQSIIVAQDHRYDEGVKAYTEELKKANDKIELLENLNRNLCRERDDLFRKKRLRR